MATVEKSDAEVLEAILFIEDGSGLGKLAHDRKAAHTWLDSLYDSLKRGEGNGDTCFKEDVEFELRMMTQKEIAALPEI